MGKIVSKVLDEDIFKSSHLQIFNVIEKERLIALSKSIKLTKLLAFLVLFIVVNLLFVPWQQTSSGYGVVSTLNPDDRPQQLSALVDGRIKHWYVRDGQFVNQGDVIVQIIDNDPQLLERLEAERNAIAQKLEFVKIASETARLDYDRQKSLFNQGLASRREYEKAKIKLKEMLSKVNDAQASLNQAEVRLSRLSTQDVIAPRSGMITNLSQKGAASFVKSGEKLADILPENVTPAVEIFVNGLDAPLVHENREVRLMFEGYPAIQVSGFADVAAIGTFRGRVLSVDPASNIAGLFRVIVIPETQENQPDETKRNWPASSFLRYGSKVRAWVLLDEVPLGFELWRQLNGFPPTSTEQSAGGTNAKK
jgi:multidrug efflux pump subunit AcrA (membrane-fusion protein)